MYFLISHWLKICKRTLSANFSRTSTTAWRYWDWKPSNDRDFTALPITTVSAAPSYQTQWTQEVRWAGTVAPRLNAVVGAFYFRQKLDSDPSFVQEQGAAAARVLLAPSANANTPVGVLDGARILGRKTVEFMTADHIGPEIDATRLREGSLRMRVVVLDPTFALVAAF